MQTTEAKGGTKVPESEAPKIPLFTGEELNSRKPTTVAGAKSYMDPARLARMNQSKNKATVDSNGKKIPLDENTAMKAMGVPTSFGSSAGSIVSDSNVYCVEARGNLVSDSGRDKKRRRFRDKQMKVSDQGWAGAPIGRRNHTSGNW